MAKVVRSEEVAPQPWANGGGTTRELLVADDGVAGERERAVPEGPVRALNVVADPAVSPHVTVLELGRTSTLTLADDQAAFVLKGGSEEAGAGSLVVGPGEVTGRSTVAVVSLDRG